MLKISERSQRMHMDFETYSGLDVTKVGASRYARHESTEPLMLAYAFDDRKVKQWVPAEGQPMPAEVEDAMLDNRIKKFAWNKNFEWHIWKYSLGIDTPHTAWRDPMVMALSLSLPGKLLKCGQVLRLDEKYLKQDGHRLINWFSKKRPATKTKPVRRVYWYEKYDKWVEFLEYNRMDVISERKIYRILKPYDLPEHEWELWALDQEINARGFPVNMEMCQNVIEVRDELVQDRIDELEEITGLDNPNAQAQLLGWLRDNGYPFDDLKAGHIRRAMEKYDRIVERGDRPNQGEDYRRVLELRSEVSRTSTKKFDAVASHTDDDGYLRNCFQFAGAGRTWRWAGRVFQPQNLARPTKELEGLTWGTTPGGHKYVTGGTQIEAARLLQDLTAEGVDMLFDRPMDAISGAVRTVVQAPKGYVFIDADLAAIENVVLGFMSGDRRILRVFEKGLDPYIDFATYLYKREYASLWAEYQAGNKGRRTIAKPGVLGCLKGDTPVLTDKGWKALVEIKRDDWLHDGEKWVRHGGVAWKGYQNVLCGSGIHVTSDHRFLTEGGWQEWQSVSQQQMFKSALVMGNGVFLKKRGPLAAQEKSFYADANVVENERYLDQTSCEDYPHVAPAALRLTVAPMSESESAQTFTTYSQIVSTLRERVAKTRRTVDIATTEVGELLVDSIPLTSGFDIQWMFSERTVPLKLIGLTMTVTTSQGISGLQPGHSRTQIADTWDILNTGDYARFAVLTDDGCVVAHNCGYMLSAGKQYENRQTGEIEATGLLGYAWNMGVKLTPEQADLSVRVWRETYRKAVQFWYDLQRAAFKCMRTKKEVACGPVSFDRAGPFLRMNLPSGRSLHYLRPKLEEVLAPWGDYKMSLTYEGLNDKYQWDRISTHPGKLTENGDQAISRDILSAGMRKAAKAGIPVVMHVHDQIVGLVKEEDADDGLATLIQCMTDRDEWMGTIPLKVAGHISKWFVKD
jgi:hypothetical protein